MLLPGTDMDVFPISFGTADLGGSGDDAFELLDAYAEAGGNFLDSAHVYAFWSGNEGRPERLIGEWMRKTGARPFISTKGGHPPQEGYLHPEDFLSPAAVQQDLADSYKRLGVDSVDLYYLHRDDGTTPVSEVIDMMNELPGVRYLGASNWSLGRILQANAYAARNGKRGFVALQSQWSLAVPTWTVTPDPTVRYITDGDHATCVANGITIHAYSSTANGYFATGRNDGPFASPDNETRRQKAVELAERLGKTPNQMALAWLLAQPGSVVPILGTTKLDHLQDALGAIGIVWTS